MFIQESYWRFYHFSILFLNPNFLQGSYVEGGMGSVSSAIGSAATEAGAHIITEAEVCVLNITYSLHMKDNIYEFTS